MSPISRFFTIVALLCLAIGAFTQSEMSLRDAITFDETDRVAELLKANPAQARVLDDKGRTLLHEVAHDGAGWKAQERLTIAGMLIDAGVAVNAGAYDGSTPLHEAAQHGTVDMIAFLLKKGADVNVRNDAGQTPLYLALEWPQAQQAAKVKALLDGNANPNLADDDGMTPIHLIAVSGNASTIKLLLGKGAKINVRNNYGETPLYLANDVIAATALLDAGADINAEDDRGNTPLFAAAGKSNMDLLTLLIHRGGSLHAVNRYGATLLHAAVSISYNHPANRARIKFLQDRGLGINAKDSGRRTPLYYAIFGDAMLATIFGAMPSFDQQASMTDILLAVGADPNIADRQGWTPLHLAAFTNQERMVKGLLGKKANVNARAVDGVTPLHLACRNGFVGKEELAVLGGIMIPGDIMAELTESDQQRMEDGLSVLFSNSANVDVVSLLVKAGADLRAKDAAGRTPLEIALQSGFTGAQQGLLKAGAPAEKAPAAVLKRPDKTASNFIRHIVLRNSPLHRAVANGQTEMVRQLLAQGAAVNARNSAGQTPLFLACMADKLAPEIIDLLLQHGAEVSAADEAEDTPLHEAAKSGRLDTVTRLLGKGAAVNVQDHNGQTPLHLATTAEVVAALVKVGAKLKDRDECGRMPLAAAVMTGNKMVVEALLGLGADLQATDEKGGTLLHAAALSQSEHIGEVISLLVAKGLDPNTKDVLGRTPLYLAALWGRPHAVEGLLAGKVDVNAGEKNGRNPLHVALMMNMKLGDTDLIGDTKKLQPSDEDRRLAVATRLLEGGATVNGRDANGATPLIFALLSGNTPAATLLLDHGAEVNVADNDGDTPLHFAAQTSIAGLIDLLLERGAKLEARNKNGQTPLHLAAANHGVITSDSPDNDMFFSVQTLVVDAKMDAGVVDLVEKGADVNAKDNEGNTPLHVALTSCYGGLQLSMAKCLLQHKADVNAKNKAGETPLIAVLDGWVSEDTATVIINLLLAQGADPNLADNEDRTPLIIAAGNPGEIGALCVKALLAKKTSVNTKGPRGNTALHAAVESGNVAVVKLLVAAGANPDQQNAEGCTSRQMAKDSQNAALIAALTPPKATGK